MHKPQSLPNALHRDMRGFRGRGLFLVQFKHTIMNTQELRMKLDMLIPTQWMSNTFTDGLWDRDSHKEILSKVVELNQEWVQEVVNNGELKLSDVLHDFKGIYSEDEHFLPRISTEKVYTFDEVWDNIIAYGIAHEDELSLVTSINGSNIEALNSVLYSRTSYRDWEQYKSMTE